MKSFRDFVEELDLSGPADWHHFEYFKHGRELARKAVKSKSKEEAATKLPRNVKKIKYRGAFTRPWYEVMKNESVKTLHVYDLDDTLVSHDPAHAPKIYVVNKAGTVKRKLHPNETKAELVKRGHRIDDREMTSSKIFAKSSRPNRGILNKLHRAQRDPRSHTAIVTARQRFDDKPTLVRALKKHGIDTNKTSFHTVSAPGRWSAPEATKRKRQVIQGLISKHGYSRVHFHDDSKPNLDAVRELRRSNPKIKIHLHHVVNGKSRRYK